MTEIGFLAAFLGGLLALLSPCSALLLPAFFAYSFASRSRLVARTVMFYAGLATTLVPLGVAGSFASRLFYGHRELLIAVGGWTVIALGLMQVAGLGFGSGLAQRASARVRPYSAAQVYLLGTVYGLAGFCAGPILGSVLTVAAVSGDPLHGGALLAAYALGMAAPLFVLAALWERFRLGERRWLRGRALRIGPLRLHTTSLVSGAFFILLGTLFLAYDGTAALPGLLDVDQEFAAEQWLKGLAAGVPDAAVLTAAGAVALGLLAWRLLRPGRRRERAGRADPGIPDGAADSGGGDRP